VQPSQALVTISLNTMTSTNTYTHSNHYLTLVCNIALKNKYTRWYFNIISRALERSRNRTDAKALLGYVEGHHILPTSFKRGGNKDPENIAFLTSREHFIIHAILVKMFIDVYRMKMINAFLRMKTIGNKDLPDRYYNSHLFSYYRKYFSERAAYNAKRQKRTNNLKHCYNPVTLERTRISSVELLPKGWVMGCPLNTKGMISICNFETKETRRIRPNEQIPDGWVRGNYRNKGNKAAKGMIRIHNPKTKEAKRIKPDIPIPVGFVIKIPKQRIPKPRTKSSPEVIKRKSDLLKQAHKRGAFLSLQKKIKQYTLEGEFLKEWNSAQEAVLFYKCKGIPHCAKGRTKSSAGFLWKFS